MDEDLKKQLKALIAEQLAEQAAEKPEPKPGADVEALHDQIKLLTAEKEELSQKLVEAQAAAEGATKSAKETKLQAEMIQIMAEIGVAKPEQAMKLIADKVVEQEDGSFKMSVFNKTLDKEEHKDLKAGIQSWLAENAHFSNKTHQSLPAAASSSASINDIKNMSVEELSKAMKAGNIPASMMGA